MFRRTLLSFSGRDLTHTNVTWMGVYDVIKAGSVNEDYKFALPHSIGNFWDNLVKTDDFDIGFDVFVFESVRRMPSHAVVRAKRVAVSNDEDFGRHIPSSDVILRRAISPPRNLTTLAGPLQSAGPSVLCAPWNDPSRCISVSTVV